MAQRQYDLIVIGLDQSYQRTGVCMMADGKKKHLSSLDMSKCRDNTQRRDLLRERLEVLLLFAQQHSNNVICLIERIRLYSGGAQTGGKQFVNIAYIKSIGALNATVVDTCGKYDVPVYSVDTRVWKARSIGTTKPMSNDYGVPDEKWPTVLWCNRNGWSHDITIELPANTRRRKHVFERKDGALCVFDTDAADAAGIAMYAFVGDKDKLELEH